MLGLHGEGLLLLPTKGQDWQVQLSSGKGKQEVLFSKINKLFQVLKDAQHHLSVGKCDENGGYYDNSYGRKRRETTEELEAEFDALMSEIDDGFDGMYKISDFCWLWNFGN